MPDIQVMGVAPDHALAERTVGNLRLARFPQDAVSVIFVRREDAEALENVDDQTGEGAEIVAGSAAKGAAIGAGIGLLAGVGTLAIPGMQVVSAPILLALFGGSGAFVGTLSGAFASESTSEDVIERYGMALREGQAVIKIVAPNTDRAKRAEEVLKASGATNVNSYLQDETEVSDLPGVTEVPVK